MLSSSKLSFSQRLSKAAAAAAVDASVSCNTKNNECNTLCGNEGFEKVLSDSDSDCGEVRIVENNSMAPKTPSALRTSCMQLASESEEDEVDDENNEYDYESGDFDQVSQQLQQIDLVNHRNKLSKQYEELKGKLAALQAKIAKHVSRRQLKLSIAALEENLAESRKLADQFLNDSIRTCELAANPSVRTFTNGGAANTGQVADALTKLLDKVRLEYEEFGKRTRSLFDKLCQERSELAQVEADLVDSPALAVLETEVKAIEARLNQVNDDLDTAKLFI